MRIGLSLSLSFFFFFFFFFFFVFPLHFVLSYHRPVGPLAKKMIDSCNGSTTTQQYLGCYVSKWRECRDQV